MSVSEVDFIGRWIEAATDEQLEEKLGEYSDRDGRLSPRDAEMRVRLKLRVQNELSRRRLSVVLCDPDDGAT